ncbi:MAG: hypothetical protein KGI75_21115 [Rhizobiaceae bacterium]|nr:hypothetical protein [Rhizobiaceae bacterium]
MQKFSSLIKNARQAHKGLRSPRRRLGQKTTPHENHPRVRHESVAHPGRAWIFRRDSTSFTAASMAVGGNGCKRDSGNICGEMS